MILISTPLPTGLKAGHSAVQRDIPLERPVVAAMSWFGLWDRSSVVYSAADHLREWWEECSLAGRLEGCSLEERCPLREELRSEGRESGSGGRRCKSLPEEGGTECRGHVGGVAMADGGL